MNKSPEPKEITLGEFIEENERLITVLGVFIALTIFSINLAANFIGQMLAFAFISMTVLVFFEIYWRLPDRRMHWTLILFRALMGTAFFFFIFYWLSFLASETTMLGAALMLMATIPLVWLMVEYNFPRVVLKFEGGKILYYGSLLLIILIVVCIAMFAQLIEPTIHNFLVEGANQAVTPIP